MRQRWSRERHLRVLLWICCSVVLWGFSGCAAIKATQQPDKRNLTVLRTGVPRTHVVAELGTPTWTGTHNGQTTDVFAFKQGYSKGVKAGRALAHGAADVVTWGLWEVVGVPVEMLADGTNVKVAVAYDDEDNVQSVEVMEGESAINPKPRKRWLAPRGEPHVASAAEKSRRGSRGK